MFLIRDILSDGGAWYLKKSKMNNEEDRRGKEKKVRVWGREKEIYETWERERRRKLVMKTTKIPIHTKNNGKTKFFGIPINDSVGNTFNL